MNTNSIRHTLGFVPSLSSTTFLGRSNSVTSLTPKWATKIKTSKPASRRVHLRSISASASPSTPTIGFIGLGVMGLPMAANLAKSFPNMVVWNRTDKNAQLKQATSETKSSIKTPPTAADVIAEADVIFSMLSTPEAVEDVFFKGSNPAINVMKPGKSLVDCSTLQIEDMVRTNQAVTERGGLFMEAPVSGSKVPAEQGQLIFLCGGDKQVFDNTHVQQALDLMGKKSFFLGPVGNGTKMKLVANQLMATMLAALGESIVLTEALDLSVPDLLEVLSLGAMNNPMFALKGPKMKHGEKGYATNFPLEHAQKDVRFAQALGDEHGISMSVSSAANEWYKAAKGLGLSRDDFAAVVESIRASAGRS